MSSETLYGMAAEFDTPEAILEAARVVRRYGYREARTYTPFPVGGLAEIFGFERTWIPAFFLAGGIFGAAGGFFMQWFANVVHLPWDIGGKPMNSWPAFIPITFEMGILFAALTGVTAMIVLNRLPQPFHAMFQLPAFERASRDRFFLCIKSTDPQFSREKTADLLKSLHPLAVLEVPR
ncbi:MAG TPA: DUF3341 domain-containing protein [Tepidisphaeraceae bacterium]|jgi:hypothetical protein|nr:DUF3341 domain-containing protein [Tepidisphaeraceae bacterium]